MNFAVFASGYGGNLQSLINAVKAKKIKASLSAVFCDRKDAMALSRAQKARIPSLHLSPKEFSTREEFDREVVRFLRQHQVDFVVLAGYMRLLSSYFIQQYPQKILNIHPSLLPAFRGAHGIRDAFDHGVKVTGVTVHFVTEELDDGAIIAQEAVVVKVQDTMATLERKIHAMEHRIYPKIVDLFARGRIQVQGRKVLI